MVGDEMQLPPTDFFSARRSAEEDEDLLVEEGGELVPYDLEGNSFLNHAAKNLPSTMLGWHYRSRSESLISFSNWAFYDGRLLTVPEEQLACAHRGAAGRGPAGRRRTRRRRRCWNARSASTACRAAGTTSAATAPRPSTSPSWCGPCCSDGPAGASGSSPSRKPSRTRSKAPWSGWPRRTPSSRERLEAELEREVDGQFVGLLVKNLENIQGDERDIVILSICYGYGPQGKMLMNFGPDQQERRREAAERRLLPGQAPHGRRQLDPGARTSPTTTTTGPTA